MRLPHVNSILTLEPGEPRAPLFLAQGVCWGRRGTSGKVVSLRQDEIHIALAEVPYMKRLACQDRLKP